jgi:ABC-type bacteriocin/lantibiotic exporter with double-glycine peptidase domain
MMAIGFQMALSVTRHFDMAIRWSISVETSMTTMQRLLAYIDVKQERTDDQNKQGESFIGNIEFQQVEMRYHP